jgi:branched-chain amino acid aminotransferase
MGGMETTHSADHGIQAGWIWLNGTWLPQEEAKVSVLSHALHYGSSAFEGIRAYETPSGPAVFRLGDHLKRLAGSAKILRMELPVSLEVLSEVACEVVRRNGYRSCYIRPLLFRGAHSLGVNPLPVPTELMVAAWNWGAYLGEGATSGIKAVTSSWIRSPGHVLPTKSKAGGNYVNSSLAKADAVSAGFDEAILLDAEGYVAEGSGENVFFVRQGRLHAIAHSVTLIGITRDTVLWLAGQLGVPVEVVMATRDELYLADEVFVAGTAAEVTPLVSLDFRPIGDGKVGPVTQALRAAYLDLVRGRRQAPQGWLTHV